ncbi:transporter [Labrys miyagiensis]
MAVVDLILPVFAVIVTGWLAGYLGYVQRGLAEGLIHFAYNIAMPALLIGTIAQEKPESLLAWRFLLAFGGGSLICFAAIFLLSARHAGQDARRQTMYGLSASMTNTGFVALPVLQALYGSRAVLPAAIATVFVAVVMFPLAMVLLELKGARQGSRRWAMVRHVVINPLVLSTVIGMAWAITGVPVPSPVAAFLKIFADALTASALFAIGLGLSLDAVRANLGPSLSLAAVKLIVMPSLTCVLALLLGLDPLYTIAAVICAAVPTAKTVYILAGEQKCEESLVASTVSITTLLSIVTLIAWLYLLPQLVRG